ncbi:MAG TPA: GntR family transcriptional regulator [Burkholderiales bacterium]|nr:GntR family transcriptional regulator [Burkholderiales bacterium]
MTPAAADAGAQTLPERIAAAIAADIVEGRHAPGERLVEARLVKAYGVSHGPVRDALRVLQSSGLVHIHPYRGAQVTTLSVREVQEIYQVRAALVGLRARWLAEDAARGDVIEEAGALVDKLDALARKDAAGDEYVGVALALNRMLTDNLSNRWLRSTLQALTLQTSRYTRLALGTPARRRESARLWRTLIDAIRTGDADEAQRIASVISLGTRDAAIGELESREAQAATPASVN